MQLVLDYESFITKIFIREVEWLVFHIGTFSFIAIFHVFT